MPKRRTAAPTNTIQTVCVSGASAMIGSPAAATSGHQEPGGTCTCSGAPFGGCSDSHRGIRLCTVGMTSKLCGGGGEEVAHSNVAPFHGLGPATAPCFRVRHMLYTNTTIPSPIVNAPIEDQRFIRSTPRSVL